MKKNSTKIKGKNIKMRRKKDRLINEVQEKTSKVKVIRKSERILERDRLLAEKFEIYWKQQCEEYQKNVNADFNFNPTCRCEVSLTSGSTDSHVILYTCVICGDKVRDMKEHIKEHLKKQIHFCSYCNKEYSCLRKLRIHIRTHTGEKPYRCTICWKAYGQRGTVKTHMFSHTGEIPYVCDYCQKGFRDRGHLIRHIRIHTGEKPYKCNACGRAFNQSGSVKSHLLRFHKLEERNVYFSHANYNESADK